MSQTDSLIARVTENTAKDCATCPAAPVADTTACAIADAAARP